jgi:hypothetical protein
MTHFFNQLFSKKNKGFFESFCAGQWCFGLERRPFFTEVKSGKKESGSI